VLVEQFKLSRETVERFYDYLRSMNYYDNNPETTRDLFERFFPGRADVHRLLMEPIAYANGSTLDDPAITYGIVFSNFMGAGVFTFRGGIRPADRKNGRRTETQRRGVREKRVLVERVLVEERDGQKRVVWHRGQGRAASSGQRRCSRTPISQHHLLPDRNRTVPFRFRRGGQAVRINTIVLPGLSRHSQGREHPAHRRLVFTSECTDVQQRRADGLSHHQPHIFRLLPGHPAGLRTVYGRGRRSTGATQIGSRSPKPTTTSTRFA
jgi:all-trans-retinol 13,14-reductase